MQRTAHPLLGRPQPGEYADYAQADIDLVQGDDILRILDRQMIETQKLLGPVGDKRAAALTYASGKRRGVVNGYPASVRGLAFHIAGHELHHMRIVKEKYLAA